MNKKEPNIRNLSENMRSIIVDLKAETERLKKENEELEDDWQKSYADECITRHQNHGLEDRIKELEAENERLKSELQQSATNCNKLRYALARLRWEHAHQMETMIDLRYTIRPSSWRFYYKSKVYWYNKWQELKKALREEGK